LLVAMVLFPELASAQVNPDGWPQPPTPEVVRLNPFVESDDVAADDMDPHWVGPLGEEVIRIGVAKA
jgi:hypothetical protein